MSSFRKRPQIEFNRGAVFAFGSTKAECAGGMLSIAVYLITFIVASLLFGDAAFIWFVTAVALAYFSWPRFSRFMANRSEALVGYVFLFIHIALIVGFVVMHASFYDSDSYRLIVPGVFGLAFAVASCHEIMRFFRLPFASVAQSHIEQPSSE